MHRIHLSKAPALLALLGLLAAGCQPAAPSPTPAGATPATPQPPAQPPTQAPTGGGKLAAPAPPVVLEYRPARGEEVPPDTPVVIRFDQPMDPASVRAAFRITPDVPGELKVQGEMVQFTPSAPYERGTRYQVTLEGDAKSQAGLPMGHPLTFGFRAAGRLEVAEVQPADSAVDISPRPRLAVVFNRPVVPLKALDEQETLPQPLVLSPPVQGKGEWLNTSIYAFEPTEDLAPGTTYTATVPAGLTSVGGLRLEEDFSWRFTTSAPKVLSHYPMGDLVKPTTAISVTFSYPMDRASAEALFSLQPKGTEAQVPGTFRWENGGRTLVFQPAAPLDWGVTYTARMRAGVRAQEGEGVTLEDETWSFQVVPLPSVLHTDPADGDWEADPYGGLSIFFASPMDFTTIMPHTTILPEPTQVYTYWDQYENRFFISWDKQPATVYTVTLEAAIADPYGNTLGQDYVIRFRTRDLDPLVHLIGPGYQIGVYSAYTPTVAYVNYRNVSTLEFALYRVDAETFGYLNTGDTWWRWHKFQPDPGSLVRSWTLAVEAPPNKTRVAAVPLQEGGGTLEPGIYYLEVRSPEVQRVRRDYQSERHMLVVTRWNLTLKHTPEEALVWVTDLATGEPVPNVPVRVTDGDHAEAGGRTDAQGLFHATFPARTQFWEPLLVLARDGDAWVAASSNWESDISPWAFNLPAEFQRARYLGYVYTDRPIYRPGQTVHWKAFLRGDDDARYTLPGTGEEVLVTIYGGDGKRVYRETHTLSGMGTLDGELALDEEAALGYYSINIQGPGGYKFGGSFQVAEYRKPEFQVEVHTDRDAYIQGDMIEATAQATYYFGGPVKEAQVRWTLMTNDYFFHPEGYPGYSFTDYEWTVRRMLEEMGRFGEVVAEGQGTTDAEGRFAFQVPADITDRTLSQRFVLDVTVTDVNGQEVATRTDMVVHKGAFYIGLKPERYVGLAGQEESIHVITLSTEAITVTNVPVTVVVNEHRWYSVQKQAEDGSIYWDFGVEDVPVYTTTVTTGVNGHALVTFTPEKGATYKIVAQAEDERGNKVRSATYLWVAGRKGEYVPWRRENHHRIDLVADKDRYAPGETAQVLVASPYAGPVKALLTVERGRILQAEVVTLESNSETLSIPIQDAFTPNAFVSLVLVKGPDEVEPVPSFRVGYVQLHVPAEHKRLRVEITPDRPEARPREEVTFHLQVTDAQGNPVRAELSLALVDRAVLALGGAEQGSLFARYWEERGLAVRTATSLAVLTEALAREVFAEHAAKGGGGGPGEAPFVRREFPDTAYWNPALQTDAQGRAQFTVRLPDSLTTWRLDARAITADTLIGEAHADLVVTLPLLVRPVVPRFFVIGDQAELAAIVHNNAEAAMPVEVRFLASGLDVQAPTTRQVEVPAGSLAKVVWPVKVLPGERAVVQFSAVGPEAADAVEVTLPVYHYSTPEVVATAGQVEPGEARLEAIVLPQVLDPTMGDLTVQIEPSLAAGMQEGLRYLEHYPYLCIEQTVSRFLPNVMTYRALKSLGIARPELETRLPQMVGMALQRIYSEQKYDGGWGWWATEESNRFLTAYTLWGLVEADRAGFAVDSGVMRRAARFLRDHLYGTPDLKTTYQANAQAFMLFVLAEYIASQGDEAPQTLPTSLMVNLYENREHLSHYGKALLAMALAHVPEAEEATEPRIETLVSDLVSQAILSATGAHWEETSRDYRNMNTDSRTTSIVLMMLARLRPDHALGPNVVRWLMVTRKEGRWETTQETAWALMALTDWMLTTGELEADYTWQAVLNDELLGEGVANRENVDQAVHLRVQVADLLRDEVNRLVLERPAVAGQTGKGRLYYTAHLRYYLPAEEVKALDRGILVHREYELVDAPGKPITQAKVGDVIRVKLTLVAPYSLYYLVVEDPLPAGCEAIDVSLQTTSGAYRQGPSLERVDGKKRHFWWWTPTHAELRDEKVALFATYLRAGTYEYTYLMRASLPGQFLTMPAQAYEMYFPEVFGRSDGGRFVITGE